MNGGQDDLEALTALVANRAKVLADFDAEERVLVKRLREQAVGGYYSYWSVPWEDIARALGVSRQAVMKRHAAALAAEDPSSYHHRRRWDAGRPRGT